MGATVTLAARELTWSEDPNWVEFETDQISGGVASVPNLSLYVQIFKDQNFLTELNAPYNLHTAKTDMDLSGLSLVYPEPPANGSMFYGGSKQGVLNNASCQIHLEYEDMSGNPAAKPPGLIQTQAKTVIYGSTPEWYGVGPVAKNTILHSYFARQGYDAIKEIRKGQPEYVYVYSHDGVAITIRFNIFYTDGTDQGEITLGTLTTAARKISWFNVGWDANGIDAYLDPNKNVNAYEIRVFVDGMGSPPTTITFAVDDHDTEYDQYIMYENGIGGCEVLRCSGRHMIGIDTEKSQANIARIRGRNFRDGFRSIYNASGRETMQLQTGYQNQYYIRHLSQLFLAKKVWYLDLMRDTFTAVTVKETSAQVIDMDSGLYNLGFTIEFDDKPSLNTFNL
jgi:hypothetical protein